MDTRLEAAARRYRDSMRQKRKEILLRKEKFVGLLQHMNDAGLDGDGRSAWGGNPVNSVREMIDRCDGELGHLVWGLESADEIRKALEALLEEAAKEID